MGIIQKLDKKKFIYIALTIELIAVICAYFILNKNILQYVVLFDILIFVTVLGVKSDFALILSSIISGSLVTFGIETLDLSKAYKLVSYYIAVIILFKLIYYLVTKKIRFKEKYILLIVSFTVLTLITAFANNINLITYGYYYFIDYFRYFVTFVALITFDISNNQIMSMLKYIVFYMLINIPIIFIQALIYRKTWEPTLPGDIMQDYISGLIGGKGTIELGLLICFFLGCMYVLYQEKKLTLVKFAIINILLFVVSVVSEIKFVFLFLPILYLILTVCKFNIKNMVILVVTVAILGVGILNLGKLYPWFNDFLSKDKIIEYVNVEYANSGMSRGNSFIVASEEISNNPLDILLGKGISSSVPAEHCKLPTNEYQNTNVKFFKIFTVAQYIIETGIIGCLFIVYLLISVGKASIKLIKNKQNENDYIIGKFGCIAIFVMVTSMFYGMSMIKESFAIIMWTILGLIIKYYNNQDKQLD
ncbi:MAG: hypothetical protein ACRCVJ_03525 [Clostridium sp.]|uniref:hypothetical protein n=1 Tax=Clostridium sp. TaxID=1506 RepID=UPI003F30430A